MSEPLTDAELTEIETLARHQRLVRPIAGVVLRLVEEVRRLRKALAAINPCPVCKYQHSGPIDMSRMVANEFTAVWDQIPFKEVVNEWRSHSPDDLTAPDHVIEVKE